MKDFFKNEENLYVIKYVAVLILIILLVGVGGGYMIDNGNEAGVLSILFIFIIWVILLYFSKLEIKNKYKKLKDFSYKFYKESKILKDDENDSGEYTKGDFEDEFEDWLLEEYLNEESKKNE